jgi:hypothetical protein
MLRPRLEIVLWTHGVRQLQQVCVTSPIWKSRVVAPILEEIADQVLASLPTSHLALVSPELHGELHRSPAPTYDGIPFQVSYEGEGRGMLLLTCSCQGSVPHDLLSLLWSILH